MVDRLARGRRRTVIRLRLAVTNASPNTVSGLTLALAHRASDDEHAELSAVLGRRTRLAPDREGDCLSSLPRSCTQPRSRSCF